MCSYISHITLNKKKKKPLCISCSVPQYHESGFRHRRLRGNFYLPWIPTTVQWNIKLAQKLCAVLQKVKQPGPYRHTADAPQRHMTGEFLRSAGLHLRPGRLNGCWQAPDGSRCPLYPTDKALPDGSIVFGHKIQKLSKTSQSCQEMPHRGIVLVT